MSFVFFMKSIIYFFKLIFIKQEYDVVFVYLNHFNRENGTNLFLKPFLETCTKNNIKFVLFEETDLKGAYKHYSRNKNAIPLDFITLLQILLRKIFSEKNIDYANYNNYYNRELKVSKIIHKLFFKKFKSKIYIILAHNNVTLWRTINKNAKIIDYQHGMIWHGHDGSIYDNKPALVKKLNKVITFVYGEGFKKILIDYDKTKFFNERNVINIGFYKKINNYNYKNNTKIILWTLQNVDMGSNKDYYNTIKKIIILNYNFLNENNYKIYFKNHPRYNKKDKLKFDENFNFINFVEDNENIFNIIDKYNISLHITSKSTTAFDMALNGIPTIFFDLLKIRSPFEMFYKQYKYPFEKLLIKKPEQLKEVLSKLENDNFYKEVSKKVYSWARYFYEDFNEDLFFQILKEK